MKARHGFEYQWKKRNEVALDATVKHKAKKWWSIGRQFGESEMQRRWEVNLRKRLTKAGKLKPGVTNG